MASLQNMGTAHNPTPLSGSTRLPQCPNSLTADLKSHSVRSGALTVGAQLVKFSLRIASTAVLARLLTPSDFGLIAMVAVLADLGQMFVYAGLSIATVQRQTITHEQVSVLFWINFALSLVIMCVVGALSPLVAWFYNEPRLLGITIAMSLAFPLTGIAVQHHALLIRQMRFGRIAASEIIGLLSGIGTAIIMASLDYGYWALVGLVLVSTTCNSSLLWLLQAWRPSWPSSDCQVRPMLRFGGGLTVFYVLEHLIRNMDNIIIGATLGSSPLGIYSRAYGLLMLPINQISRPLGNVLVPALSRLQHDPVRFNRAFTHGVVASAAFGMPVIAYLFLVADQLVLLFLGPGWERAATIFRLLTPAALLSTVYAAPLWLSLSLGRSRPAVAWALVAAPTLLVVFLLGAQWGLEGVALSFSMAWYPLFWLFLILTIHGTPARILAVSYAIGVPLAATAIAGLLSYLLVSRVAASALGSALGHGIAFGVAYTSLVILVPLTRRTMRLLVVDGFRSIGANDSAEAAL